MGWENWINLTVWKFTHCLQSVLQNIRRNSKKKQEHLSSEVTDETTPNSVQLPSEFIDCLSVQSNDTEQSTNASPKPNAIENLNNAETAVDQLLTDQFSSEMHADLIVLQEGNDANKKINQNLKFSHFPLKYFPAKHILLKNKNIFISCQRIFDAICFVSYRCFSKQCRKSSRQVHNNS